MGHQQWVCVASFPGLPRLRFLIACSMQKLSQKACESYHVHFVMLYICSLVPRPHPAHTRRRGLVLQVQILGLAPKVWSGQSDRRRAFIRMMRKRNKLLQSHRSKWCYDIHFSYWQICNPTLTITRLQYFRWPTRPLLLAWARWGLGTRLLYVWPCYGED